MKQAQILEYQRPLFVERQRFTQKWLWAVLVLASLILLTVWWFAFRPVRSLPGAVATILLVALVLGLNGFYLFMGLTVRVDTDGVHIRFPPFVARTFRSDQIAQCETETYDAIGEFGGWGIRGSPDRWGWAYNVRGNRGVRITFTNGHRLLIGSQRTEALCEAIRQIISLPTIQTRQAVA